MMLAKLLASPDASVLSPCITHASGEWPGATPVEQLGETIAELAARLQAATYELLVLLRQFDAANGWSNGFLSCAHWLSWRTGIDPGAAREKVRVARALASLPRISAAMARGELSYSKVRAITRVATPDQEQTLLDVALAGTAAQVERIIRASRRKAVTPRPSINKGVECTDPESRILYSIHLFRAARAT